MDDALAGKLGNPDRLEYPAVLYLNWHHAGLLPGNLYDLPCVVVKTLFGIQHGLKDLKSQD